MKNCITTIISSSVLKIHPSIEIISEVIESLKLIPDLYYNNPIIIALDGCKDNNLLEKYNKYIDNLKDYLIKKNLNNSKIILNNKNGHLSGNIRNIIKYINTKYILLIQHDLPFIRSFNIKSIIEDMKKYPKLKHIRLNFQRNKKFFKRYGFDNGMSALDLQNPSKEIIKKTNEIFLKLYGNLFVTNNNKYITTGGWSDRNHISTVDYYKKIVLKEVPDGVFMGSILQKKAYLDHKKYGTYIYGDINQLKMVNNLDGSGNRTPLGKKRNNRNK